MAQTDTRSQEDAVGGPGRLQFFGVWLTLGLAVMGVLLAMTYQAAAVPLPGRVRPDPVTTLTAGLLEFLAGLSSLATIGMVIAAGVYSPLTRHHHELGERGKGLIRWGSRAAQMWFAFALLMSVFGAGFNAGVPFTTVLGDLGTFIWSVQWAAAWLVTAIAALIVAFMLRAAKTFGGAAAAAYLAILAMLPPVVTGNVTVGADHDFGTDGAIVATLAQTVWFGSAIAVAVRGRRGAVGERLSRHQGIAAVMLIAYAAGRGLQAWFELAGTSPTDSVFGWFLIGLALCVVALAVRLLLRNRALRAEREDRALRAGEDRAYASAVGDLAILVAVVAIQAITSYIPPPRFAVPQPDIQINYLGYTVNTPPLLSNMFLLGRPTLFLVAIAVVCTALYLWGYIVLRRRGGDWPWVRVLCWVAGWAVFVFVTATALWKYSAVAFRYHMLVHMTINMVAPTLLVIGGPITLALKTLRVSPDHSMPGPREMITAVLGWKPLEVILNPLLVTLNFVASFYVLYFSELFGTMMKYHWAHQLMMIHFLISGSLFYGQIIGTDRPPRALPHVAKLGLLFAAMPFHAFFAVGLMMASNVIGGKFYQALDMAWVPDLMHEQQIGGQITWATGELPMLLIIIVLVAQWVRQDSREAKRKDRAMDSGLDDSFEAYNEMLAELAKREQNRLQK